MKLTDKHVEQMIKIAYSLIYNAGIRLYLTVVERETLDLIVDIFGGIDVIEEKIKAYLVELYDSDYNQILITLDTGLQVYT